MQHLLKRTSDYTLPNSVSFLDLRHDMREKKVARLSEGLVSNQTQGTRYMPHLSLCLWCFGQWESFSLD